MEWPVTFLWGLSAPLQPENTFHVGSMISVALSLGLRSVLVSCPYHLRRICSLLLLGGEFPKCQLDQLDGWRYSVQQYPY